MARPSSYTPWKGKAICMRLARGESLRSICRRKGYPSKWSVQRWLLDNKEFRTQYAYARELQAEHYLDEIIEISDDNYLDTYEDSDGNQRTNHDVIARSRLMVDTRKWAMARMAPKKYSERVQQDHTSSDGSMSPDGLTSEQRKNRIAELMNKNSES